MVGWTGVLAVKREFGPHEYGILNWWDHLPFAALILFTIIVFVFEGKLTAIRRKPYRFAVSIIGITFIITVVFRKIQVETVNNSANAFTIVTKAGTEPPWRMAFKKNNWFCLTEFNLFGRTECYGKYSRQGDTIRITRCNYNGDVSPFPEWGVIKRDTISWNGFGYMTLVNE